MSNLPNHLHEREDGIWLSPVDPHLWDLIGEPERSFLSAHPNDNPTTEPMLPLPFFSVEEFVAFERCGHLMDLRTVYLKCEVTEWETNDEGERFPTSVHWTGLNEDGEELAAKRRRCGELLRSLLNAKVGEDKLDSPQPYARYAAHEDKVLAALRSASFDPLAIPRTHSGRRSPAKQAAWSRCSNMMSRATFDKAWERLRQDGRIREAGRSL